MAALTTTPAWLIPDQAEACLYVDSWADEDAYLLRGSHVHLASILDATTGRDGLESLGLLAGISRHGVFEVWLVSGPGPNAVRRRYSANADFDYDWQRINEWRSQGVAVLGDWHAASSWHGPPSKKDMTVWAKRRRLLAPDNTRLSRYLAIIASPAARGGWDLDAYSVRSSGSGDRDVCQPIERLR